MRAGRPRSQGETHGRPSADPNFAKGSIDFRQTIRSRYELKGGKRRFSAPKTIHYPLFTIHFDIEKGAHVPESWTLNPAEILPPKDFLAAAVAAGIKPSDLDLALLYSNRPASGAAVFTTNVVKAAPVELSQRHLLENQGLLQAMIVNSGNANACTGDPGMIAARAMAQATADTLAVPVEQVLVCSTGVIGVPLPVERVTGKLNDLKQGLSPQGLPAAARAILTTDTTPKVCTAEASINGRPVRIAGMTKGAGMIHPQMATTLGFVLTDATIGPALLRESLQQACRRSYNRISVDGDTSTNDTLAIMANGGSGMPPIQPNSPAQELFVEGLTQVCQSLAQQIVRDGEGASKFVTIRVTGAPTEEDAAQIARSIANSPLVKTALAGEDANWGRIICAAGYAGVPFDSRRVSILLGDLVVCREGGAVAFQESRAAEILRQPDIDLTVHLHAGSSDATFWTCDLTTEYIHINADYRT